MRRIISVNLSHCLFATIIVALGGTVVSSRAASVNLEAEAAQAGSDFATLTDAATGTQYRTILTDIVSVDYPGNASRVLTFNVTFPEAGTYDLYARVRVGPGGFNDDSFFYGNGFGTKNPASAADWIRVNNLATGGYTDTNAVVDGGGLAGSSVWKWIDLSRMTNSASERPLTFTVTAGNLTQTFQIGARENGLDMDKFLFGTSGYTFTVAELDAAGGGTPPPPPPPPMPGDQVNGNLIQYDDNGTWTWYSDERAVVDAAAGKLIVGCVENGDGVGGVARDGNINATIFDLYSRVGSKTTLKYGLTSFGGGDDHNAPAVLVWPNGKYLAMYTGHNSDHNSFYSIYNPAAGTWGPDTQYNWDNQPGGDNFNTTYSHLEYLSAEGRTYDFARGNGRSPNFIVTTNFGETWDYGGQLTTNGNVGYVNGYFKFWGNGVDRVDFICTEYHPRDFNTSIYHGYISNGMSFRTDGTVMDTNIFDKADLPTPQNFTTVFAAGTVMPAGQTNYRCWNDDVCRYADGTIAAIISTRVNNNVNGNDSNIDPDHAFFYCRYDGTNWTPTYLCKAGKKLYSSEADYVGLGCLNPDDPNTIYISTPYDPRDDTTFLGVHEIFKGTTTNRGASFTWTPITWKSDRDNFRPIMPAWDHTHAALCWFRGTYISAQILDVAVVGLIDSKSETVEPMTYVDASTANTTLADGSTLATGPGLNQWHDQTAGGNDGSVLSSCDAVPEDAPMLKTHVVLPGSGAYDVWVNFWGPHGSDWRIVAGLSTNTMQLFRQMACREVESGDHNTTLILTNSDGAFLHQAYLGRVTNSTFDVFVDDNAIRTGTTNTLAGDTVRTWYDGVSFARVDAFQIRNVAYEPGSNSITITWNSTPAASSLTTPTYTVQRKDLLTDAEWTTLATDVPSAGSTTTYVDASPAGNSAFYRVTTP